VVNICCRLLAEGLFKQQIERLHLCLSDIILEWAYRIICCDLSSGLVIVVPQAEYVLMDPAVHFRWVKA